MDHQQSSLRSHGEDNIIPKMALELRTLFIIIMSQSLTIRLLISSSWPQGTADLCCVLRHYCTAILTFTSHQGLNDEEVPCFHLSALLEQHFGLNEGNTDPTFMKLWGKTGSYKRIETNYCYARHRELWKLLKQLSHKEPSKRRFPASPVYFGDFCLKGLRDKQLSTKNASESHWVAVFITS